MNLVDLDGLEVAGCLPG